MAKAAGLRSAAGPRSAAEPRRGRAGPLRGTYSDSCSLSRTKARVPTTLCHCVIIAYGRTVRSDDHQAGDAVAPRDARPQRLLLGPEAAVPAVRREAGVTEGGGSGEPRAPCGLASPLLERGARVS